MKGRVLVGAVAILAAAPTGASAYSYPGQHDATQPRLYAMLRASEAYWEGRAPASCEGVRIALAPSLMDTDGIYAGARALRIECTIVMQESMTLDALHFFHERNFPVRLRRQMFQQTCAIVAHEAGHLRGLDHAPSGVMAPAPTEVPYTCSILSRKLIRRRHVG